MSDYLLESEVPDNPMALFAAWYTQAEHGCERYANPVSLATADTSGQPLIRTVLMKGFSDAGFRFFTNYQSRKGRHWVVWHL